MIASGIFLAALEQQVITVVTVNGRSAAAFAEAHTGTPVFGPLTAQRQSKLQRVLRGSLDAHNDIRPLADLAQLPLDGAADDIVAYIIEDPQMRNWPEARREAAIPQLGNCRAWVGQLEGSDLGYGRLVLAGLRGMITSFLPGDSADRALSATDPIWTVNRGEVYAVSRVSALAARALQAS